MTRSPFALVFVPCALVLVAVLGLGLALAQADRFGFMPAGGIGLLDRVLAECDGCDDLAELSTTERTTEAWRAYFAERDALSSLTDVEIETLARYLAARFPTDEPVTATEDLPRDGRTIVIQQCQVCHSIAIPMLEDREVDEWLQHRNRPPHDSFDLDDTAWTLIAEYLALNAPIEEESIPLELRKGAGGY